MSGDNNTVSKEYVDRNSLVNVLKEMEANMSKFQMAVLEDFQVLQTQHRKLALKLFLTQTAFVFVTAVLLVLVALSAGK